MSILVIDFMNQAHRARSGFSLGPAPVVFNFFRNLRSLVKQFKPNRTIVVLEGRPKKKIEILGEYKANRIIPQEDTKKVEEMKRFFDQVDRIVRILSDNFPVSVVRHPTFECDDTIANILKASSRAIPWTIVSNDSDFIQLLHEHENLQIWNPMKKEFMCAPDNYDYATWKSLRGDGSDNIPGIPGIGDKTAEKIASDPTLLAETLSDHSKGLIFSRNYELIKFQDWSEDEKLELRSSSPKKDWDVVKNEFETLGFKSITKEGSWEEFTSSFDHMWP